MFVEKLDSHGSYTSAEVKRLQVVYLHDVEHLKPTEILQYVDYAISTIRNYVHKFKHLLQEAINTFKRIPNIISKVDNLGKVGEEKCYLFKFYNNTEIVFSKIGTTTREILKRLKEEIKQYYKDGFSFTDVIIESVFNCGELSAEGAESQCRAKFIKEYPKAFKKNDRFIGIDIPVEIFNKTVLEYLE